jgi:hypothetical protein
MILMHSHTQVRLALAQFEYQFHSSIEEMWSDAAVKMSDILSVNCSAMTLDFFTAWCVVVVVVVVVLVVVVVVFVVGWLVGWLVD